MSANTCGPWRTHPIRRTRPPRRLGSSLCWPSSRRTNAAKSSPNLNNCKPGWKEPAPKFCAMRSPTCKATSAGWTMARQNSRANHWAAGPWNQPAASTNDALNVLASSGARPETKHGSVWKPFAAMVAGISSFIIPLTPPKTDLRPGSVHLTHLTHLT